MQRRDRSERIIDAGRQSAQPDFDQFVHEEMDILNRCSQPAERKAARNLIIAQIVQIIIRVPIDQSHVRVDKVSGAHPQFDVPNNLLGDPILPLEIDMLNIPGSIRDNRATPRCIGLQLTAGIIGKVGTNISE